MPVLRADAVPPRPRAEPRCLPPLRPPFSDRQRGALQNPVRRRRLREDRDAESTARPAALSRQEALYRAPARRTNSARRRERRRRDRARTDRRPAGGRPRLRFRVYGRLDGRRGRRGYADRGAPRRRAPGGLDRGAGFGRRAHAGGHPVLDADAAHNPRGRGGERGGGPPSIVIRTGPTTGGVAASFASIGDITLAEPGAIIGFAGARVIEETIREKLPEGLQRAKYLDEHGMVARVVPRGELHAAVPRILPLLREPVREEAEFPAPLSKAAEEAGCS